MFIGHYAVGLAAKRAAPRTSLGWLILAPTLADLLWPVFLLLGWEQVRPVPGGPTFLTLDFVSYPWSHSLVMDAVWGTLLGGAYYARTRYRAGALAIAGAVLSHWVLDVITHIPDMPVAPWGGTKLGLGLWHSVPGTLVVEILLYAMGAYLYARTTRARDAVGRYATWGLIALLFLLYVSTLNVPPPPGIPVLAVSAIAFGGLFVLWAWWGDRHRDVAA
jgi:membrane-bound metal-dependent hydrolase YbcI (DUF457 family)